MTSLAAAPSVLGRADAVRFLQRATFGGTPAEVQHLMAVGVDAWFADQFARQPAVTYHLRRVHGVDLSRSIWEGYLSGPDQLRKRTAFALSQIFVVSDVSLDSREVAPFADLLEAHCFGTYRNLLEQVTRSVAMGRFLSYNKNRKADTRRGTVPDENYAREVLQLFSIGLWALDPDGTRQSDANGEIPAYGQDDILGLARVFTGFEAPPINNDNERFVLPMVSNGTYADRHHERGAKSFLGVTIPASENRTLDESLQIALDTLANHPNVGPFIGRQLIQRLVTSNPSPGYVGRVAAVFADDGSAGHVRGNLAAVVRAILTDDEAWQASPPESFGKLREPVLRFTTLVRAFGVGSTNIPWALTSLEDQATELGQQPFEAPSVFNFFRPGYVPPQSSLGAAGLTSPEMQIANETSAIGWVNFAARFVRKPPTAVFLRNTPNEYESKIVFQLDELISMIAFKYITTTQAAALVDEIAARLCPGGLSAAVRSVAAGRLVQIYHDGYEPTRTEEYHVRRRENVHLDRVVAAAMMIAVSTDFLHER